MVVSTAKQLRSTYMLWRRFTYPSENGPRDAIAVPVSVGNQLNAAYAVIIEMMMVRFWSIVFGTILYIYIRRRKSPKQLAFDVWNKKADLGDLVLGMATTKNIWNSPRLVLLLFLIFAALVGQTATGILVPPQILLGSAAPSRLFPLEAPRFLRALGSTAVDEELRHKVNIDGPTFIEKTGDNEDIQRIDYSYNVTGADLGLQRSPGLTLNVIGSCITDYGLYENNEDETDYYTDPTDRSQRFQVNLYDGRQPTATFFFVQGGLQGTLPTSNTTWVAIISSVYRISFSPSTDPWYLTSPTSQDTPDAGYEVKTGRPALSCWQDDVWSYQGHKSTVDALTSNDLPGLDLPPALQRVLASVLGAPVVPQVGQYLQASALLSSTTAIGRIFDARASSAYSDLVRLVEAAYVATTNCLTDLTLYPAGAAVPNDALDPSHQPMDGIADFVVWSPDVAALSTVVVIVVPSVFVGVWLIANILLLWTPIGEVVTKLEREEDSHADESNAPDKPPVVTTQEPGSQGTQTDPKPNMTQGDIELGNNAGGKGHE
ncbi:hypothetical protein GGS26DRAFT_598466 [Hypomontagnella submonticulosa]|nr:hypothetical protein GGS26DRAFT_598466 [Hypomontagnella submonticulosa]